MFVGSGANTWCPRKLELCFWIESPDRGNFGEVIPALNLANPGNVPSLTCFLRN